MTPETEQRILACRGHLTPEGIIRVFGCSWEDIYRICHEHKTAFDVNQVRNYSSRYQSILMAYLKESRKVQGFPAGYRVDLDKLIKPKWRLEPKIHKNN